MKRTGPVDEAAQLRQLIREAHEACKDLRDAVRDAKALADRASADCSARIEGQFGRARQLINEQLDNFTTDLADKTPLQILCSRCGTLTAALVNPTIKASCAGCGLDFAVLAEMIQSQWYAEDAEPGRAGV